MTMLSASEVYRHAVEAGFEGQDAVTATAVAMATSGGNTAYVGEEWMVNREFGPAVGLWGLRSLRPAALRQASGADQYRVAGSLSDPTYSAQLAKMLHDAPDGGWGRWRVFRDGRFRRFIDDAGELLS